MPEGPSIVILKEAVRPFKGKTILKATGNTTKIDIRALNGKKIKNFKSWGKHFLIVFDDFFIRIHFLMFGSYTINERKPRKPRLQFIFEDGEINFYSCSIKLIEENLNDIYDWESDVMNKRWNKARAAKKLRANKDESICDLLLDQTIFAGVGNIIKNEVLFRTRLHPLNTIADMPVRKIGEMIDEAVNYSFDFLKWKKKFVLKKHWLVHTKKICQRCGGKIVKEYLDKANRRTFYCPNCQKKYRKGRIV